MGLNFLFKEIESMYRYIPLFILGILMLSLGCVTPQESEYDSVLQAEANGQERNAPKVYSLAESNKISIELESSSYKEIEFVEEETSIKVVSYKGTPSEALGGAISGNKLEKTELDCTVDSFKHEEKDLFFEISCDKDISESGNVYGIDFNFTVKTDKNSMAPLFGFPSCDTSNEEYDLCEGDVAILLVKK